MKKHMSLAVVVLIASTLSGCLGPYCSENLMEESHSPNGKYVAAIFVGNCGATTPLFYHVNLRRSEDTFSADSRGAIEYGQVFVTKRKNIRLTWKDDRTLSVECFGCQDDEYATYAKGCIQFWEDVKISCTIRPDTQAPK